jgi:hypothetical protein
MNNSSLLTADRTTHLKIVLVSLICATVIAGIGIANRMGEGAAPRAEVIKAAPPVTAAAEAPLTIR